MERKRSTALVLVALTMLALLCIATRGTAQQPPAAKSPVHKTTSASAHSVRKIYGAGQSEPAPRARAADPL